MLHRPNRRPQFFYTTAPLPCPYLAGRTERKIVTELTGPEAEALHDRLSRAGFRRSHNIAYSPVCPGCSACIPIRIIADQFEPNRVQRKLSRMNGDISVFEAPARATAEQFALFQRYQQARHGEGDMAAMGFYDYRAMVEDTPITTGVVEFRDARDRLVGACLTDWLSDGLSAVYSFFEPAEQRRSLGTWAILWLVQRARSLGLPFVYLGYWVPESRKMAYKSRFRPSEILTGGVWRVLEEPPAERAEGAATAAEGAEAPSAADAPRGPVFRRVTQSAG
jgi:arginine-tRNA-protein transferase